VSDISIIERRNLSRTSFDHDIVPGGAPAVLRGLITDWPAYRAAQTSPSVLADYLKGIDGGQKVGTLIAPPEVSGRYFYDASMRGFNFQRREIPFVDVIDKLIAIADDKDPMGIYAGSVEATGLVPGFATANPMPLVDRDVSPRLWLGNASRIAAHHDVAHNIACVVSGRRRFTLFPPDQIGNLYIGPLDFNMAGPPSSLVDFAAPDFDRFPKFRAALDAAIVIDLAPGDGVYMPPLWWHHVEAFGPFNLLANYWWSGTGDGPAFESLVLALLGLRDRAAPERAAWKAFFDHYIFGDEAQDAANHIPDHARSVLGPPDEERTKKMLSFVMQRLSQR
jgi:Cupin-like domain